MDLQRLERDRPHAVVLHETDRVLRVRRADVEEDVALLRPERGERLVERVEAARRQALRERVP
jgi:hypothetical protein